MSDVTSGVKYASSVTHWPAGPLKGLTFSNGTALSQTFNLRYEPLTIASGPVSLALTPAKAGGFTAIQVGTAVSTYGRDFLDHLVSATPSTGAPPFTYRYIGDRITEAWTADATPTRKYAFGYDDQTNLSAISVFNALGTLVTSTTCLVHDGLNRLVAVGPAKVLTGADATACRIESDISTVQVRFQYDAQNRRIARQDGTGAWKQYAMAADGSPLSELWRPTTAGGAWSPIRDYVWLDSKPLTQVEYSGPQVFAVHSDHLGLPRALTSAAGSTVWSAATRPYGDLVETSSTGVVTNLRLPGQYDEKLLATFGIQGPYYNWNRWYLPMAGRYMELDPIAVAGGSNGAAGPEWYGYSEGNPVRWTDASGACFWDLCLLEGAALEAALAAAAASVVACTVINSCPWSKPKPVKCQPTLPLPNPNPLPFPLPPLDLGPKKAGCYCACAGKGVGPTPQGRVASPEACISLCKAIDPSLFGICR